ncbi:MAG: hypothetical protein P4K98_12275 [Bryobacteraceae bacterium]|nr:hypothetical protein [Bryobacteraceae bacterium]
MNPPLQHGHVSFLPVVPGSVEFAAEVRRTILETRPEVVAVPLWRGLQAEILGAVARLPELSAIAWSWSNAASGDEPDDSYWIIEPGDPYVEALRSARETGAEVLFLLESAPDGMDAPNLFSGAPLPDSYAASRLGVETYTGMVLANLDASAEANSTVAAMASALQGSDPTRATLAILDLPSVTALMNLLDVPAGEPEPVIPPGFVLQASIVNLHPDCLAEVCGLPPFYAERYEHWREQTDSQPPDRLNLQRELLRESELNYAIQTNEKLSSWQRRQLARFSRKLACSAQMLLPDLFDLLTAARGVVDDNFAWEVWHAAGQWPWQLAESELETRTLTSEDLSPYTRRMQLHRMPMREKRMRLPRGLKNRPKERFPGEWAQQIDGDAICSYPPEDLVIEDYGRMLRQKARSMLSEDRTHVEPFRTSLLDGVDVRETIRNWHRGELWVRRSERLAGEVGAVVVVFDEDPSDRYPYCTTWLGEHQNESDMAFYSTFPFDHMIGPGIGRAEYGGFLMVLPSRRMFDVWSDADYDSAESKSERLLLAGLDYSLERHVLYVAAKPPRSVFRNAAARLGRNIIYLPIGQLSSAKLKKIRVVHVLDGYQRRRDAKEYLW